MKKLHPAPLAVTLTRRQAWPIQAMLVATGDDPGAWATRILCATALAHISAERQRLAYVFGMRSRGARPAPRGPIMVPVPIWPTDMAPAIATFGEMVVWEALSFGGRRLLVPLALTRLINEAASMIEARSADWVRMVLIAAAEPYWLPRVI